MESHLVRQDAYLALVHDPRMNAWFLGNEFDKSLARLPDCPDGDYTIIFDPEDGSAMLHGGGEGEAFPADELLGYDMYQRPDKQNVKVWATGEAPTYLPVTSARHELSRAAIDLGPLRKRVEVQLAHSSMSWGMVIVVGASSASTVHSAFWRVRLGRDGWRMAWLHGPAAMGSATCHARFGAVPPPGVQSPLARRPSACHGHRSAHSACCTTSLVGRALPGNMGA